MKNEDLTPQLSKMPYEEMMDKIRAVRKARVTPSEPIKPKKRSKAKKATETKLEDMLEGMSPEDIAKVLGLTNET